MQRKPDPRTLAVAFLVVSAALSVIVLAVRNLYDDEIVSLDLIVRSVTGIVQATAEGDVHPPGMYLLAHLAYRILPSFRWMNLFPGLVLYAGLTLFLLEVTPLLRRTRSQLCLLLLATLHPQLLLWSVTFRWYGWWTGIALIALTFALQLRDPKPTLGTASALTLGLLLACLFYLNYITFLFVFALGAAMLLRYHAQPWKRLLPRALLILGVFLVLISPQLPTMLTVHLPMGRAQRYDLAISFLRLLQSVYASEAYLPWHPLAILADLLFAGLCVCGLDALLRRKRDRLRPVSPGTPLQPCQSSLQSQGMSATVAQPFTARESGTGLTSIAVFGLLFFLLVAATGLGGKPRNGLLLIPILAPTLALLVGTLRPRAQAAALLFFTLWSTVGIAHLLGRYGLTKSTMNDRPEQVVAFIERTMSPPSSQIASQRDPVCSVVVTYDIALAFSLAQAQIPRLLLVSPYRGPIFGGSRSLVSDGCGKPRLYVVQSYLGGSLTRVRTLDAELQSSTQCIEGQRRIDRFSFDPDASRKRSLSRLSGFGEDLSSAARLPDYRYVVTSGTMDRASLEGMRRRMPHFLSGYQVSVDEDDPQPHRAP